MQSLCQMLAWTAIGVQRMDMYSLSKVDLITDDESMLRSGSRIELVRSRVKRKIA
jgi:hypothetical protein